MKKIILLIMLISLIIGSCTRAYVKVDAQRPTVRVESKVLNTEHIISNLNKFSSVYEDEYIKASWTLYPESILLTVLNKNNGSIKINWDNASFSDLKGFSSGLVLGSTKLVDKNKSQLSSVIIKQDSLKTFIFPANNVIWKEDHWEYKPIFKPAISMNSSGIEGLRIKIQKNSGEIKILLPIQIENKNYEYLFIFNVGYIEPIIENYQPTNYDYIDG